MKKLLIALFTICLFVCGSTCFAAEGEVEHYQDIIIDINGQRYDTSEDIESAFKGINKVTVISTHKENIRDTNLRKFLNNNDNYHLILTKSEWFGDEIIYNYGYLFVFDK